MNIKSGSKESADAVFGPFDFQPSTGFAKPYPCPTPSVGHRRLSAIYIPLSSLFLVSFCCCRPPAVISSFAPRTRACTDRSGSRPSRSGCRPAHPISRPAHRPRSQAVENTLRTGCVYGRKPYSPQHGAASRRCGVDRALESGVDAVIHGWI